MLTCKEITELATDYAEGHLAEAHRDSFVRHLAGCRGCATWVKQLETAVLAIGALPEPELPAALEARLMARFDDWARERSPAASPSAARRPSGERLALRPALAAVAAFGLLVALARRPSASGGDWAIALALAFLAAALAALWHRLPVAFSAIAASSSLVAAFLVGGRGSPDLAVGADCLLTIGGLAGVGAAAAWGVSRREPRAVAHSTMGAWAVAGALTSVAALQITCAAHSSLAHLLTFHVGGLALVIAAAHLGPLWRVRVARG